MADIDVEQLLSQFTIPLLEVVSTLECSGRFRMFFPNFFTFIQVDDNFTHLATEILASCGFEEGPLMSRPNTPRTHISVLNSFEQRRVPEETAYQVERKWRNREVPFRIETVEIWRHIKKETGEQKLLCCFKVKSAMIEAIREDLGKEPTSIHYNMHMSVSEKYLE